MKSKEKQNTLTLQRFSCTFFFVYDNSFPDLQNVLVKVVLILTTTTGAGLVLSEEGQIIFSVKRKVHTPHSIAPDCCNKPRYNPKYMVYFCFPSVFFTATQLKCGNVKIKVWGQSINSSLKQTYEEIDFFFFSSAITSPAICPLHFDLCCWILTSWNSRSLCL